MRSYGVVEAKNRLSELIERARGGEEVTITRRGEVVARLVPPRAVPAAPVPVRKTIARIKRLRKKLRLRGLSVRGAIDDGRR